MGLRLESEAVDEVSAQHGLGVCPSRAAFPGSLTFQMPSELLPCAPRIDLGDDRAEQFVHQLQNLVSILFGFLN